MKTKTNSKNMLSAIFIATNVILGHNINLGSMQAAAANVNLQAIQVAATGEFVCVLTSQGGVKCWGSDFRGALGDGISPAQSGYSSLPVQAEGLNTDVIQIDLGDLYGCALLNTGSVKCWGANDFGQLANSISSVGVGTPMIVAGLAAPVTQITAGDRHTCALLTNGNIQCWGSNFEGRLGTGSNQPKVYTPETVIGINGEATSVWASDSTCAVLQGGDVRCWGSGFNYLITGFADRPIQLSRLVGGNGCAVLSNGMVQCWQRWPSETPPTTVPELSNIRQLTDSCALSVAGELKCSGAYPGNGTLSSDVAVNPTGLNNNVSYTSGNCAVLTDGGIRCWGQNYAGKLGLGFIGEPLLSPVNVIGFGNHPICGNNLLSNPGFEQGLSAWNRWDTSSSDSTGPNIAGAYTGAKALKLSGTAGGVGQVVSAIAGQNYIANAWTLATRLPVGTTGRMGLRFYDNNWGNLGTFTRDILPLQSLGDDPYLVSRLEAVAPHNTTRVEMWFNKTSDTGEVYADETCLFTDSSTPPTSTSTPNTPTSTPTSTPTPSPATCTANLLTNPNFTTDLNGWNRWDNNSSTANSKLQIVGAGGIGQHRATSAGQSYTLKASASSSGNATLGLTFYDAAWNLLSRASAEAGGASSTRSTQATAPANTALVEVWVWNSSGTLSADDFCLTVSGGGNPTVTPTPTPLVTPSPTPLITPSSTPTSQPNTCTNNALANGGFESDFANWQRWDTASSIGSDTKAGSKALRIGPGAGGIGQHISVTPGTNISLSAWSKLTNGGSGGRVGLTFFNSQWQQVGSNVYADVGSASYARHDLSATVPAGASLAQVWVYKSGILGDQWLDEVCLQGAGVAPVGTAAARMVSPGRWVVAEASRAVYLPLLKK